MTTYFSPATFKFFRGLARNNSRDWFHANKARYEAHVREPFQRLLDDLQPVLTGISPHYRVESRKVGGSLFRIHRDTRFANDKSPYKTWQGVKLFHERSRQIEAPSFHIHVQPGRCFVGSGLWHPGSDTLRRVRNFVLDNPAGWKAAAHGARFRKRFALDDSDMLIRMPRGFPAEFEFSQDLRRKNFIGWRTLEDHVITGPDLLETLKTDLTGLAGFTDYLCAAVDLEF